MILWTFQPYVVYEKLMQKGEYSCQPDKSINIIDDPERHFTQAYQWMIKQMKEKIGVAPKDVTLPIWAWYRWNYKHQCPKFFYESGNDIRVCLKIKIPDDQVLLSEFDKWHYVLNRWYLNNAISQNEWDKNDKWFNSLPKKQAEEVMKKSWQNIFDISPRHGIWTMNGGYVQGCFWKLTKDQVCQVWRLERGRKSYRLDLMTFDQISQFKNI